MIIMALLIVVGCSVLFGIASILKMLADRNKYIGYVIIAYLGYLIVNIGGRFHV